MIVDQSSETCAHKGCTCEVPPGQTYCSPHCANAATAQVPESGVASCQCGHPQCGAGDPAGASRP